MRARCGRDITPPSRGCFSGRGASAPGSSTGAWGRSTGMGPVKVCQHDWIQDGLTTDPGLVLRAVSLPVDQILEPTLAAPGVEDIPDGIDGTLVQEQWRGGGSTAELDSVGEVECGG